MHLEDYSMTDLRYHGRPLDMPSRFHPEKQKRAKSQFGSGTYLYYVSTTSSTYMINSQAKSSHIFTGIDGNDISSNRCHGDVIR